MKVQSFQNSYRNTDQIRHKFFWIKLVPILFVTAILPLIIHSHIYKPGLDAYPWYHDGSEIADIFLYHKQWLLVAASAIMLATLLIKRCVVDQKLEFCKVFLCIILYAVFAVVSSGKSAHSNYACYGFYDMFQGVFALLSYCVVLYYTYSVVNHEDDIRLIVRFLIGSMIALSVLGVFQITSHDPLRKLEVQKLFLDSRILEHSDGLKFDFELNRVYLTLSNSNYVGVYTAMMIPILICLIYFSKKVWKTGLYIITLAGMTICLVGSKSKAGIVAVGFAGILIIIFLRKQLIKKWYFTIIGVIGVIAVILGITIPKSPIYSVDLSTIFNRKTVEKPLLEGIETDQDGIYIQYKGNVLKLNMESDGLEFQGLLAFDQNDMAITDLVSDDLGKTYYTHDERFQGIEFMPIQLDDQRLGLAVIMDGSIWRFCNKVDDTGKYYFINNFGKVDNIGTAEGSAVLKGHESIVTGRGFIWSRTIPLLKNHLLIGCGANVFAFEFPSSDYVGFHNYGFENQTLTKPHSWYLQMGVETGVISMVSVIVFYLLYLITSVRLYRKSNFEHYSSCVGVAIFIGITSYLIAGISNDSIVAVAPVFWALTGCGIAINCKFHKMTKEENKSK